MTELDLVGAALVSWAFKPQFKEGLFKPYTNIEYLASPTSYQQKIF